jgi:3-hydroxyisobutyrate dehydrogenase
MTNIAFLGLGAMGSRMAANILKAGHDLTVWSRNAANARFLVEQGARQAASPREAAANADIIISMVTDDDAARDVWLNPNSGVAGNLNSGAVAIECSTVTPAWIGELSKAVSAAGSHLLDAPVAGSRPQAESGQLVFMVGGDAAALETAKPVLQTMGANIMHIGGGGQGAVLKLAVNSYFAAQLASMAELLGYLDKNGIVKADAANLMAQFPIVAPPLAGAAKMMAAGNTTPMFTLDLIGKDLRYIQENAASNGASIPLSTASKAIVETAISKGFGEDNISGLVKLY